jgi:hypothetical protein
MSSLSAIAGQNPRANEYLQGLAEKLSEVPILTHELYVVKEMATVAIASVIFIPLLADVAAPILPTTLI